MAKAIKPKAEDTAALADDTSPAEPTSDTAPPVEAVTPSDAPDDQLPAPVDPYEAPPEPVKIGLEATVKEIVDAIKGVDEGVKQALVDQAGRFETVRSHRPDGTEITLRRNIDTGAQTLLE